MYPFWILLELKMTEVVVTTGAIRYAKLQSDHHYQQMNTSTLLCTESLVILSLTTCASVTKRRACVIQHCCQSSGNVQRTGQRPCPTHRIPVCGEFRCPSLDSVAKLYLPFMCNLQMKGSVKEQNISIYFFFCPSLSGVLFPMFCLLVEGDGQILVF